MNARALALLALACAIAGCSSYSTVGERCPRILPPPPGAGILRQAEQSIAEGLRRAQSEPAEALGDYVAALQTASAQLAREPHNAAALRDYNFALARIFTIIRDRQIDPWSKPLHLSGPGGEYILTHKPDPRPRWNPALYEFIPADQIQITGTYVANRTTRDGLGASLVAVGRGTVNDNRARFSLDRMYYGVTAVARFEGRRCVIEIIDPLAQETATVAGHSYPLAADFTAPLAVALARENPKKRELARLLRPEKFEKTARLAALQPYDPNKSIVLIIHGLGDSPATWTPMVNTLRADPEIRRRYQFWFFSYPSGYPYPHSAALLRHELDAFEQQFPLHRPITVIGHSMGGCISRLLITDTHGDRLFRDIFGQPPSSLAVSAENKKLFTDALIFQPRKEVGRVIFISAPLRGSDLASNWLGRIGSSLVKAPTKLLAAGAEVRQHIRYGAQEMRLSRIPNSVDTLAPNNRFVLAINKYPITPGVPYHTIVGDRGRGDSPNSSDGVVPYWSSVMPGARSAAIVPSNHSAHQNPQAIAEVRRILLQAGR